MYCFVAESGSAALLHLQPLLSFPISAQSSPSPCLPRRCNLLYCRVSILAFVLASKSFLLSQSECFFNCSRQSPDILLPLHLCFAALYPLYFLSAGKNCCRCFHFLVLSDAFQPCIFLPIPLFLLYLALAAEVILLMQPSSQLLCYRCLCFCVLQPSAVWSSLICAAAVILLPLHPQISPSRESFKYAAATNLPLYALFSPSLLPS